jgi:hypothetical protein
VAPHRAPRPLPQHAHAHDTVLCTRHSHTLTTKSKRPRCVQRRTHIRGSQHPHRGTPVLGTRVHARASPLVIPPHMNAGLLEPPPPHPPTHPPTHASQELRLLPLRRRGLHLGGLLLGLLLDVGDVRASALLLHGGAGAGVGLQVLLPIVSRRGRPLGRRLRLRLRRGLLLRGLAPPPPSEGEPRPRAAWRVRGRVRVRVGVGVRVRVRLTLGGCTWAR